MERAVGVLDSLDSSVLSVGGLDGDIIMERAVTVLDSLDNSVLSVGGRSTLSLQTVAALERSVDTIQDVHLRARRTLNAITAFLRLPPEILRQICRELLRMSQPWGTRHGWKPGWLVVLWVSHHLRVTVEQDPVLWAMAYSDIAKMESTARAGAVPLVLALSRSRPFTLHRWRNNTPPDRERLKPLCTAVNLAKCGTIRLENRGNICEVLKTLVEVSASQGLPVLRELKISMRSSDHNYRFTGSYKEDYFEKALDVPNLIDAYFDGLWIPLRCSNLQSLSCVHGFSASRGREDALRVFQDLLLPVSQTLRSLCIDDSLELPDGVVALPPVSLPKLEVLELGGRPLDLFPILDSLKTRRQPRLSMKMQLSILDDKADNIALIKALGSRLDVPRGRLLSLYGYCQRDTIAYRHHFILLGSTSATGLGPGMRPNVSDGIVNLRLEFTSDIPPRNRDSHPLEWYEIFTAIAPFLGLQSVHTAVFDLRCLPFNGDEAPLVHPDYESDRSVWTGVLHALPSVTCMWPSWALEMR